MDTWKFGCGECNHKWTKKLEFFSDIDWNCPICKKNDKTSVYEYIPEIDTKDSDVVLGTGGCRQK